jgi:fructosamine-3-kinase
MLDSILREAVEEAAGAAVTGSASLRGGCIAETYRIDLADGRRLVAKRGGTRGDLVLEGLMLAYLGHESRLPVPAVLSAEPDLLLMEFLETAGTITPEVERHAAELVADLHGIAGPYFGFERDTLIASLPQPNPPTDSWIDFFRDHRLLHMGREAAAAGRLPAPTQARLERWLIEPARPALVHGDMWTGNVLCRDGRIAGFADPAIHYAGPEVELAFTTLFGTFGAAFFERYHEIRPLAPGFFETRRLIYNLYPLLVHTRLFGGPYPETVARVLERFGF